MEREPQYVGIDLHRRRSVIVRMSDAGEVLGVSKIDNDPLALAVAVAEAGPNPEVALEATYGWVRHEAPYDRVGCKDPPAACRSRPLKLRQPDPWDVGEGGSSPYNAGVDQHRQMVRVRQARRRGVRMQKPVVEPPQEVDRLEPGGSAGMAVRRDPLQPGGPASASGAGGHGEVPAA